jgi:hypothetical protein
VKEILRRQHPPLSLPACSRFTARWLWWTNREFSPVDIIHLGSPCSYITCGMNSRPVGGRSSETLSHHIDLIIVIVYHKRRMMSSLAERLLPLQRVLSKRSPDCKRFTYSILCRANIVAVPRIFTSSHANSILY